MLRPLAELFVNIGVNTQDMDRGLNAAQSSLQDRMRAWTGMVAGIAGTLGVRAIGQLSQEWVSLLKVQEQAEARVGAVLKATGNSVGYTADELKAYASELQNVTTTGDETILNAMAKLLTFKSVTGDVFKKATEMALDMAATGFTSAEGAAVMLGKALEDPVRGVSAMRRVGVSFSEVQQKQINALVKSNKLFEAQNLILNTVAKQGMENVARSLAELDTGKLDQITNAIGDMKEEMGKGAVPVLVKLAAVKLQVWKAAATLAKGFRAVDDATGGMLSGMATITAVALPATTAIYGLTAAIKTYNLVTGKTASAKGALLASLKYGGWLALAAAAVWGVVKAFQAFSKWLTNTKEWLTSWPKASENFGKAWLHIKSAASSAWDMLKQFGSWLAFSSPLAMLAKWMGVEGDSIAEFASNLILKISNAVYVAAKSVRFLSENWADVLKMMSEEYKAFVENSRASAAELIGDPTGIAEIARKTAEAHDATAAAIRNRLGKAWEELDATIKKTSEEGAEAAKKPTDAMAVGVANLKLSMLSLDQYWLKVMSSATESAAVMSGAAEGTTWIPRIARKIKRTEDREARRTMRERTRAGEFTGYEHMYKDASKIPAGRRGNIGYMAAPRIYDEELGRKRYMTGEEMAPIVAEMKKSGFMFREAADKIRNASKYIAASSALNWNVSVAEF